MAYNPPESQNICYVCRWWVMNFDIAPDNSINDITKSAQAGCLCCQFMLDLIGLETQLSKGEQGYYALEKGFSGPWRLKSDPRKELVKFSLFYKTDGTSETAPCL